MRTDEMVTEGQPVPSPTEIECVECRYEGRGFDVPMPYTGITQRGSGWTNVAYGPCPVCGYCTTALWGFNMIEPVI